MKRYGMMVLAVVSIGLLATSVAPGVLTEESTFDPQVEYSVVYTVNEYETETVRAVHLLGLEALEDKVFLTVESAVTGSNEKGFILLDAVRAILPATILRERTATDPRLRGTRP